MFEKSKFVRLSRHERKLGKRKKELLKRIAQRKMGPIPAESEERRSISRREEPQEGNAVSRPRNMHLTSLVFDFAFHPKEPILAVGLVSGALQMYDFLSFDDPTFPDQTSDL